LPPERWQHSRALTALFEPATRPLPATPWADDRFDVIWTFPA
jgi:hypothetical protein